MKTNPASPNARPIALPTATRTINEGFSDTRHSLSEIQHSLANKLEPSDKARDDTSNAYCRRY
jgi:hypothetical protein